jgi:predicted glycosyltransferase
VTARAQGPGRSPGSAARTDRKRLLFYVHDGTGLGHLQRLSKIARALQSEAACLIVTGHRAAAWLVPETCEYVRLPSLDSLLPDKAAYWGREPFLAVDRDEGLAMRRGMLDSVVAAFAPDALITDYLPLGKHGELAEIVERRACRKYFILRGILDRPDRVEREILGGRGGAALAAHYDRIFVAGDRRIVDVAAEYAFPPPIAGKLDYVGYVVEPVAAEVRARLRSSRLGGGGPWVVCSAGGGALGEALIEQCLRIAADRPGLVFDIVVGPRSSRPWPEPHREHYDQGSVRIWKEHRGLNLLHAAADVVICPGGYNSLLEALQGDASILCVPVQIRTDDEQYVHAERLRRYRPIETVPDLGALGAALDDAVRQRTAPGAAASRRPGLDMDGIAAVRRRILADLR